MTEPHLAMEQMIGEIESEIAMTASMTGIGELSARTIDAMRRSPRHLFIPAEQSASAYRNRPLPIGKGQTISQPFIVAIMTESLAVEPGDRILEVGTGSGYQTAVLSQLADLVYTVERIDSLLRGAQKALAKLQRSNVRFLYGDGYQGWPQYAPYDKIIVTAAAPELPPALLQQLREGGRLVIPIGEQYALQQLVCCHKKQGVLHQQKILDVAFVPLKSGKI